MKKDPLAMLFTAKDEEEIVEFFVGLIPILQKIKADLEGKGLIDEEFLKL
jgi:hypothetical protein